MRENEVADARGPIFIVGTIRSGSTLLRLVLDSHEHIAIGPESGFMGAVAAMKTIPGWDAGPEWYRRFGLSDEDMDARIRNFFSDIFQPYAAGLGKTRWGDKTPFHTWHIQEMATIFPTAVFIGIVRHPAATTVSMRRWRYTTEDSATRWARVNAEIVRQAVRIGPRRFALCRYEDLVLDPEPTLRALLDFLGEPWSDAVLRHQEVQRRQGAPRVVEGGTRTDDAIDRRRVGKWREEVDADELATIAACVPTELLELFGYAVDRAEPGLPGAHREGIAPGLVPVDGVDLSRLPARYATGKLDPDRRDVPMDPAELAHRLERAEREIERYRAHPALRLAHALRRVRRAGGVAELRDVVRDLRRQQRRRVSVPLPPGPGGS